MLQVFECVYACTYVCVYIYGVAGVFACMYNIYVCVFVPALCLGCFSSWVCMHACVYVCMYACVCMHDSDICAFHTKTHLKHTNSCIHIS
jgi:hypothetical protein